MYFFLNERKKNQNKEAFDDFVRDNFLTAFSHMHRRQFCKIITTFVVFIYIFIFNAKPLSFFFCMFFF